MTACVEKALAAKWPATVAEARSVQQELRARVRTRGTVRRSRLLAGLDAHYGAGGAVWGAAAALRPADLQLQQSALARRDSPFPYIPGYLSFREAPALLAALAMLTKTPDLLFIDGQGIAHPRRFGLACHVGVLSGIPTIGVAKSRLVGAYDEPGEERGAWSPLHDEGEVVGAVLRTRSRVRPVFVSVGHKLDLEAAVALVLAATSRYRLPEPTRLADRLSRFHP